MKKIRIGKDIIVRWPILTSEEALPLAGRNLRLFMHHPNYEEQSMDFLVDGNTIIFTFYGIHQKLTGCYSLTIWENYGKEGQTALDACNAFELVSSTCKEADDYHGLTSETLNLASSNLDVSLQGLSAYEVAVKEGFNGNVDEWLESLRGPAGYSPMPGNNGNWWVGNDDTDIPIHPPGVLSYLQEQHLTVKEQTQALENIGINPKFDILAHSDCTLAERIAAVERLLLEVISGKVLIPELQVERLGVWGDNNLTLVGSGAPAKAPDRAGQFYIDTDSGAVYKSTGNAAVSDWKIV